MKITGAIHDVEWNSESVARFWDNMTVGGNYFSDVVGDALIRLAARSTGGLKGRILDYGCGPGILMDKLARRGLQCEGADTSPDSLAVAARRLGTAPTDQRLTQLKGLPSPFPDNSFDAVFFVETIEHVLPERLPETLAELLRIVRPGGHVIVTTPNDEDLKASESVCPDCGCRYHRMQHVSSWTSTSIAAVAAPVPCSTVVHCTVSTTGIGSAAANSQLAARSLANVPSAAVRWAARPMAPQARVTSTSTVGFPRESRISRALISTIWVLLMMEMEERMGSYKGRVWARKKVFFLVGRPLNGKPRTGDQAGASRWWE